MRHLLALTCLCLAASAESAEIDRASAENALLRAVGFYDQQVSTEGGYLWRYSADLSAREGEGKAGPTTAWVQPPGTPSVGDALLAAFQRTRSEEILKAARRSAMALVRGQLRSGGWDYRIEFADRDRSGYRYRVEADRSTARNTSTLDDDVSQSALRFLMRFDQETKFQEKPVHDAVQFALRQLLAVQYPNGAWPQRFSEPPDPAQFPVRAANYPESWPREHPKADYRQYYTFNDNSIATLVDTLFLAAEIYQDDRYAAAARRAGDFIVLAQMPEPQPAWAQQYNAEMQPAWARRFEPPAVTGGESQGVLRTLLTIYQHTGEEKYAEPIPRAIAYLRSSQLPDGRLARFYELRTNRPLYFTRQYELTYDDSDLPTHYGFQVGSKLDSLERELERLKALKLPLQPNSSPRQFRMTTKLVTEAERTAESLDERGAWVEAGSLRTQESASPIIDMRTFIRNIDTLSRYVAAKP